MHTAALVRAQQVIAGTIVGVVLLLAVLAGRFLFLGDAVIELHGYIGNGVFFLALVNVALAVGTGARRATVAVAGAIALLAFAQVGLGYVGRNTEDAAALHVPNGVLLMGLAVFHVADLRQFRQPTGR